MSIILPAFSSSDLKVFPLYLRHCRSFGSAPSLPNLPRAGRCLACFPPSCEQPLSRQLIARRSQDRRDCVIYSVPHTLLSINPTDSPKHASRSWPLPFLVTNVPEPERPLSPARPSVRPAPAAPYGLASYGICGRFSPLLTQTRKPSPNTIGQRWISRFGVSVFGPSSSACRWCRELYKYPCAEVLAGLPSRSL